MFSSMTFREFTKLMQVKMDTNLNDATETDIQSKKNGSKSEIQKEIKNDQTQTTHKRD